MFKSYFLLMVRNMARQKFYSTITILGFDSRIHVCVIANVCINAVPGWPQTMTTTIGGGMVSAISFMRDVPSRLR